MTSIIIKPHGQEATFTEWGDRLEWPTIHISQHWNHDQRAQERHDAVIHALLNGTFDIDVVKVAEDKSKTTTRYVLTAPQNVRRKWRQPAPETRGGERQ